MIYKYDDIVKTTEERYIFQYVGAKDIGKAITIKERNDNTYGGYITKITNSEITYKSTATFYRIPETLNSKTIYDNKDTKICIYDPMTGEHVVYRSDEFVYSMKSKIEFNTDILIPGSKFFVECPRGTSIFEVLGCGRHCLRIKECSMLEGTRIFVLGELGDVSYDANELKGFTFKTMDELKPFDLFRRGFCGYKLSAGTICDIRDIIDEKEIIVDD